MSKRDSSLLIHMADVQLQMMILLIGIAEKLRGDVDPGLLQAVKDQTAQAAKVQAEIDAQQEAS